MRPLAKSAVDVVSVGIEASGVVPATVFGDGKLGFLLCSMVGKEKTLIAFLYLLVGGFLYLPGTSLT